jgi:hypothetical protein
MIHQKRDTGTATSAYRQRDNDATATRVDAQTDTSRTAIASPFDASRTAWKSQRFRSRPFHSAHKGQM